MAEPALFGAGRHRRRVSGIELVIVSAGVVALAMVAFLSTRVQSVEERTAATAQRSGEVRTRVTLAHLWLEEAVVGDPDVDLARDVYANLDAAIASCRSLRPGEARAALPGRGAVADADAGRLCRQLRSFRVSTDERWRSRATSGPGSPMEEAYDRSFRQVLRSTDRDRALLQATVEANRRFERRLAGVMLAALAALFAGLAAVVRRHRLVVETKNSELAGLAAIVERSDDAIIAVTLEGVVVSWNGGAERLYGYAAGEVVGGPVDVLLPPGQGDEIARNLARVEAGEHVTQLETKRVRKDGQVLEVSLTLSPVHGPDGGLVGVAAITRDVTGRNRAQRQLAKQAFYDSLTDLANRSLFRERLGHAVDGAGDGQGRPAVLVIDLDGFKEVNDTLGHPAGDRLLMEVAARLRACVGPTGTAARIGGDQFAVVLEGAARSGAERVAARIGEACRRRVPLEGRDILPYASIGVALWAPGQGVDDLLRNADAAMYAAKAVGGNHCQVYEEGMHAALLRRLELASELRGAVERGELTLHYQPIVATASGRMVGTEALVRWNHPRRGLLQPDDFIPVAEETGMVRDVGRWVLETACRQARAWQTAHPAETPLYVSVNVAAAQLRGGEVVADVERVLATCGLPPASLVLEITETSLVGDFEEAVDTLHRLKGLGVKLSIDDFGTGYSSLTYLRRMPVDVVKIDRSFVTGIASAPDEWALAVAIVRLVKALSLQTVAEGVETAAQVAHLRALGCDFAQGYYFVRPQPPAGIDERLALGAAAPLRAT